MPSKPDMDFNKLALRDASQSDLAPGARAPLSLDALYYLIAPPLPSAPLPFPFFSLSLPPSSSHPPARVVQEAQVSVRSEDAIEEQQDRHRG